MLNFCIDTHKRFLVVKDHGHFFVKRLELRHVDGVIISSTAGHICDTAIIFSNCRIAYLVFFIANGYHTIFFCEGLVG